MRNDAHRCFLRRSIRVGLLVVATADIAYAEPSSRPGDAQVDETGRRRFAEGVAALKSAHYDEARIAFQQSYALKPVSAALRNLAATELKTARYVDAARHFATYLKMTKGPKTDRSDVVEQGLTEAKSHCGIVIVEANIPGAEIRVDDEFIGRTPMGDDPWFGEPGEHQLSVRLAGYEDYSETIKLDAGEAAHIGATLRPVGLPTPAIASDGNSPSPLVETLASSSEGQISTIDQEPPVLQPSPSEVSADAPPRARLVPIVIGGGLTIVGLAVGVGYSVASSGSASDRDALLGRIPLPSPRCGTGTPYDASCAKAHQLDNDSAKQRNLATAGFVMGGVAGAATLAYWLWPRSSPSQAVIVPAVAPAFAGIQVRSSF